MLDERIAELIQADVDGELEPGQRPELTQALEQSEDARAFHSEMMRVARLMTDASEQEPPWGLRRKILNSIELPVAEGVGSWFRPASYGLAVAAGVMLAVGLVNIAPVNNSELGNLVGTMVKKGQNIPREPEAGLAVDLPQINGQVWLKNLDEAWVVEFELESDTPVEVMVDFSHSGMKFGGYADQAGFSGDQELQVSGGEVRVVNQGNRHFMLFLRNVSEPQIKPQEIGIAMNLRGEKIYQGALQSRE